MRNPTVLVVDDAEDIRSLFGEALRKLGYQVVLASSGPEALDLLDASIDAVLLDVMMPGADGYATCRAMKEQLGEHFVPIALLTALDDTQAVERGALAGADEYLTKPISIVALELRLRSLLALKFSAEAGARRRDEALRQLELARRELLEVERLATLGTFAAGVGHELNNVASVLSLNLGFLSEELASQQPLTEDTLTTIRAATQHVVGHARALLALGAPPRPGAATKGCEAGAAVRGALGLLRGAGRLKHLEVVEALPGAGCAVPLSRMQVEQVVINLVGNAADALEEAGGGRITVRLAQEGDGGVALEVEDNGPGMTPEVRAQLFQPFFTTKPPGRGTGLGLRVVRELATSAGGEVNVRSERGRGTAVLVTLPAPKVSQPQA